MLPFYDALEKGETFSFWWAKASLSPPRFVLSHWQPIIVSVIAGSLLQAAVSCSYSTLLLAPWTSQAVPPTGKQHFVNGHRKNPGFFFLETEYRYITV